MSDKHEDVFPLIIGVLAGLFIYLSRKKAISAQELNVTVNESVSINTDASALVTAPNDVVINDSINVPTSANLSVTAPSSSGGGESAEANVIIDDSVNIPTSASLSVA
jgi:hypothetical protein